MKAAATATVGAAGLVGFSGSAAAGSLAQTQAPDDYPRVSTRDHFNDDAELINGNNEWNYDTKGDWGKYWNGGEECTIFVHGFLNGDDEALLLPQAMNSAYEADLALQQNGHDEFVVCYSWDSDEGDSLDVGWTDAKAIANRQGRKLGNFITWWSNNVGTPINLVAHSLGARVVGSTLSALRTDWGAWRIVDNVALFGAAIDHDTPAWGEEYGYDIYYSAQNTYNHWSDDDGVLDYIYELREWDGALGQDGSSGDTPGNYQDVNVTWQVDTHFDYYQRDIGCMPTVASNL